MLMRAPLLISLIIALVMPSVTRIAWSGVNKDAKLIIHLVPTEVRKGFSCYKAIPKEPKEVRTAGKLYPQHYFAYVLITDFNQKEGIAGVQFGLSYDGASESGVDIESGHTCTLYEWPMDDWPASATGNLLTWDQAQDCQDKPPIPVYFFYLTSYTPDRMKIIPRGVDGLARVSICGYRNTGDMDDLPPEALGWADFGGESGYNPWDPDQNLKNLKNRFKPIKSKNR